MALTRRKETTTTIANEAKVAQPAQQTAKTIHPLWWILAAAIALFIAILLAAAAKQLFYRGPITGSTNQMSSNSMMHCGRFGDRTRMRGGMMDDNEQLPSNSIRVSGVVTAIDGMKLTIAGYGASKIVEINDKTEYYGAAQPVKVNDTVMISGTSSGDTFTASRITIRRQ